MPTKKRRVGFIPRSNVLEIINKLSLESNLSNSKIINILVEEALQKRGILNNNNDKSILINKSTLLGKEFKYETLDLDIYKKFLMFLKFQEKMQEDL